MPPSSSTPSRSRSRNRSGIRGFLTRSWATLKRLCGTRKAKNEPECRTIRSGNKNLTVNVRNKSSLLQRLIATEPNTPEYRRILRAMRNQDAPSPIRLPAISNRNFFRSHPNEHMDMPAFITRVPNSMRSYRRSASANRLFGSPRPMGTRRRARGGAYSRSRTALNNLASVEAALQAMNQAKGRSSKARDEDPMSPGTVRRPAINVSRLLSAARTNALHPTLQRTLKASNQRPSTPPPLTRRPTMATAPRASTSVRRPTPFIPPPVARTRARPLSSNRINLKPVLNLPSNRPSASWFQRMFGRKRPAYQNALSKVRGHRNYSSYWWMPSPGFRPNQTKRGSRAAFR